jgi:hypothetical protein
MTSFESSFFLDAPQIRMHAFDRRVRAPRPAAPDAGELRLREVA